MLHQNVILDLKCQGQTAAEESCRQRCGTSDLWGRVWGLGFGVWGLGFGVWGVGFRVQGLGLRV